ncbi:hypothetical protein AMELA_G00088510 [Ameiurus melas]|uniref:Uncharacterized protein n=1 Tax=Ameiurus melas TaxID=219545 RepID=A0A7J6AVZ4_AMEME|nr:hypothetical protein AMELA_G00088510 [Ameiurus melas]
MFNSLQGRYTQHLMIHNLSQGTSPKQQTYFDPLALLLVDQNTLNDTLLVFEIEISWPLAPLVGQWQQDKTRQNKHLRIIQRTHQPRNEPSFDASYKIFCDRIIRH